MHRSQWTLHKKMLSKAEGFKVGGDDEGGVGQKGPKGETPFCWQSKLHLWLLALCAQRSFTHAALQMSVDLLSLSGIRQQALWGKEPRHIHLCFLSLIPTPGKSVRHEFLEWMKTCDHLLSICSSFLSCFKFWFSKIYILYLYLPTHNIMSTYTIFPTPHPKTKQKGFPLPISTNFTIKLHIFPPYISKISKLVTHI